MGDDEVQPDERAASIETAPETPADAVDETEESDAGGAGETDGDRKPVRLGDMLKGRAGSLDPQFKKALAAATGMDRFAQTAAAQVAKSVDTSGIAKFIAASSGADRIGRVAAEQIAKSVDTSGIAKAIAASSGVDRVSQAAAAQIAKAVDTSGIAKAAAEALLVSERLQSPAIARLAHQQSEMAKWQEENRIETERISQSLIDAKRRQEDRADAQAEATIAIAEAQERLQELQAQGLELATAQTAAIAEVAQAQQQTLATIQEELEVLRAQQVTLEEQRAGQEDLIKSGFAGGVVMEWTLWVAIIAAVATIVLAFVDTAKISTDVRIGALATIGLLSLALAISQWRRRPSRAARRHRRN